MGMTKLYVVVGETGEYDDHREWPVGWCASAEGAKAQCETLNKIANGLEKILQDADRVSDCADAEGIARWRLVHALVNQLKSVDPAAERDYTGVRYTVATVDRLDVPADVTINLAAAVASVKNGGA